MTSTDCTCRTEHLTSFAEIESDAANGDAMALWWVESVRAAQSAQEV
jgi:hypothetical protein